MSPAQPPAHSSELRYVFGQQDLEDASARALSDTMQRYWTNFAKTGDPNGPGVPAWPKYDAANRTSAEFANEGPVLRKAIRAAACAPYDAKYARDPKPLTGGARTWIRGPAATGGR